MPDYTIFEVKGALKCSCAPFRRAGVCNHIAGYINEKKDVIDLSGEDAVSVEVPLFVISPVAKITVSLAPVENEGEARYAEIATVDWKNYPYGWEKLGTVYPGVGRSMLRNMILAWLVSMDDEQQRLVDPDTRFKCQSRLHPKGQSHRPGDPESRERLVNLWFLLKEGRCSHCIEAESAAKL